MNEKIKEKLNNMPMKSGVYIMKDSSNNVIYVGKAKRLKNRVSSYFNGSAKHTKVLALVEHITDLDYIICDSEYDALALESNLIKKYMPFYNILLKDGKAYPYIRVGVNEPYGKVEIVRKIDSDGAKYFGPYVEGVRAKELIELINNTFLLPNCGHKLKLDKPIKPCINYSMGLCVAPCAHYVTPKDYKARLDKVIDFLSGNDSAVEGELKSQMQIAVEKEDFERAIKLRDYLKVVSKLKSKVIAQLPKTLNADLIAYISNGINNSIAIGSVRAGKLLGIFTESTDLMDDNMLEDFIVHYYTDRLIPSEIYINRPMSSEVSKFLGTLAHHKVRCFTPLKGVKKSLLDMAIKNANQHFIKENDRSTIVYNKTLGAVYSLQKELRLDRPPMRIECYDISHISGTFKVGSMVVFIGGQPAKNHYRKFKIKEVEGNNDFESLKEVIRRRLGNILEGAEDVSLGSVPDLMVIDGGKGQLSSVMEIFKEVDKGVTNSINVVSLAKRIEEVFVPNTSEPIILDHHHYSLKLLQKIRDEAHRFAITFHRDLRGKGMIVSVLDGIKGVGQKRKLSLLRTFKTVENLKNATLDEIEAVDGMSKNTALNIFRALH